MADDSTDPIEVEAESTGGPVWREPGFRLGVVPVSLLHLALSIRSMAEPALVVIGDRAEGRLQRAHALASSADPLGYALEKGWPGDYGIQSLLLSIGGLPLLLLTQLALFVATLVLLYVTVRRLSVRGWAAGIATTVYALLASNLHQPHTVVSEAFFNPAVAAATFLVVTTLRERDLPLGRAAGIGACVALAVAVRPVFLPVLPAFSVGLVVLRSGRVGPILLANAIALMPLLVWGSVQLSQGEEVQLGSEGSSLEHNLAGRMRRMHALGGDPIAAELAKGAGVGAYIAYASSNPVPFLRVTATDGLMLVINPGVNLTYGVFLGFFPKTEGTAYWVPLLDEKGPYAAAMELLRREPARLLWNAFGLATWTMFGGITVLGLVLMARGPHREVAWMLCAMTAVLAAATFTSHAVRWSQRSPMEFTLAIFFAAGLPALVPRRSSRGMSFRLRRDRP